MKNFLLWSALALIWSSSYLAIRVGVAEISPLAMVSTRMIIGAMILVAVLRLSGRWIEISGHALKLYLVSGVMGSALPFALISYGERHVGGGLSALMMGIAPVATVLLAPFVHVDEKLDARKLAGVAAGIAGLLFMFAPSALEGAGQNLYSQVLILGAALCYAFTTLFVRKYADLPPLQLAAGSLVVGAILSLAFALLSIHPLNLLDGFSWSPASFAVLYLGIFPTAVATLLFFHLVPRIGAARVSQVNFVVPVAGSFLGVVVLHEPFRIAYLVAMVLVLVAVYLVSHDKPARAKPVKVTP